MPKRMFKEATAQALGYAVVARKRTNPNEEIKIITTGISGWDTADSIQAQHYMMQAKDPSYYDGYYISLMNPGEYLQWLTENNETPCCRACGRPLAPLD